MSPDQLAPGETASDGSAFEPALAEPFAGDPDYESQRLVPVAVQALPNLRRPGSSTAPPAADGQGTASDPNRTAAASPPAGQTRAWQILPVLLAVLESTLRLINWPFSWLRGPTRELLGWTAVATLAVSFAAWVLLPRLCPPRDYLVEFRARYAVVRPSSEQEDAAATSESHGAKATKGHGGGHAPKPAAKGH